jgi:hypothetical protein
MSATVAVKSNDEPVEPLREGRRRVGFQRPCASGEGRCASVGGRAEECRSDQRNGALERGN